ncbi:hypothetical protein Trydic_g6946 [Trypoxylus dichotomus]
MGLLSWLLSNKLLVFFCLATTALCVSTIVLAVQYSNLQSEVDDLKEQLSSTTTSTATAPAITTDTTTITAPATTTDTTTITAPAITTDTTTITAPATTTETPDEMANYRLPNSVIPVHYDLHLNPDLTGDSGNFEGKVVIRVSVQEATRTVKLHNNGLTISSVTIDGAACTYTTDTTYELLNITPENGPLDVGAAEITIEFSGSMENRIVGLYISSYTNGLGEVR